MTERRVRSEEYKKAKADLYKARRKLKEAADLVGGVEFTEEERELLLQELNAVSEILGLGKLALGNPSAVDVVAELAVIEERRQWGPGGRPG